MTPARPDPVRVQASWRRAIGHEGAEAAWAALAAGYGDPARAYHDWTHIARMLDGLDAARAAGTSDLRFDEIELAILFHDAVYDPRRSDNEAASATLFTRLAGAAPLVGAAAVDRIAASIHATRAHAPSDDPGTRLLLDLDLLVLGDAPDRYRAYAGAVRREYAHVPDALWAAGRDAVLAGFLARARIFQTDTFAVREAAARANLMAERESLGRG